MVVRTLVGVALFWAGCAQPRVDLRPIASPQEGLRSEQAEEGTLAQRLALPDLADLVLLYGSDLGGALAPCGCQTNPRGGLARVEGYTVATRSRNPRIDTWYIDAGGWLDGTPDASGAPRPDAQAANAWMLRALHTFRPVALNLSLTDLIALQGFPDPPDVPMVSANLQGPGIVPMVERTSHDLRVVFTGISATGLQSMLPPGYSATDPYQAARTLLADPSIQDADLVVLLAHNATTEAAQLAREGWVDVVVDAQQHRYRDAAFREGDAVWVKAYHQTHRLGELRLGIQNHRAAWALDRKVDMDEEIPVDPHLDRLATLAEREVATLRHDLYGM